MWFMLNLHGQSQCNQSCSKDSILLQRASLDLAHDLLDQWLEQSWKLFFLFHFVLFCFLLLCRWIKWIKLKSTLMISFCAWLISSLLLWKLAASKMWQRDVGERKAWKYFSDCFFLWFYIILLPIHCFLWKMNQNGWQNHRHKAYVRWHSGLENHLTAMHSTPSLFPYVFAYWWRWVGVEVGGTTWIISGRNKLLGQATTHRPVCR